MEIISVTQRTAIGRNANKKVRKSGEVPAIIYGEKQPSIPISLPLTSLLAALHQHETIKLKINNGPEAQVRIKEVQQDALSQAVLHVDFVRVQK